MQPHRIRADKPGRADYPLLMRQCLRTHFDDLSATRSDETGAAAMVRCRCGRSRLRESAACSRDSAQLSARKRGQEEIGSDPILHPMHGTASRTNASDHAAPLAQIRLSSRTGFHDIPDYSFGYAVTPVFACPTDTSEQSSDRYSGCSHPKINGPFDPFGNRHGSNVAPFADQINYDPMFLALL